MMKICKVDVTEHRGGILVDGLHAVRNLLALYMSGVTPQSGATMANQPSPHAELIAAAQSGNRVPFLLDLFDDIGTGIAEHGHFRKNFDNEGLGPFFKTTVEVTSLAGEKYVPDGIAEPYLLGLSAAYVGSEVEVDLAKATGLERGLWWANVELTLEATGPEAVIDLSSVLDPVRGLLDLPTNKDVDVAEAMMPDERSPGLRSAKLATFGQYAVSLVVSARSVLQGAAISRKGAVISAPRRGNSEGGFQPLWIALYVEATNRWRGRDSWGMPVLHHRVIGYMHEIKTYLANAYIAYLA